MPQATPPSLQAPTRYSRVTRASTDEKALASTQTRIRATLGDFAIGPALVSRDLTKVAAVIRLLETDGIPLELLSLEELASIYTTCPDATRSPGDDGRVSLPADQLAQDMDNFFTIVDIFQCKRPDYDRFDELYIQGCEIFIERLRALGTDELSFDNEAIFMTALGILQKCRPSESRRKCAGEFASSTGLLRQDLRGAAFKQACVLSIQQDWHCPSVCVEAGQDALFYECLQVYRGFLRRE